MFGNINPRQMQQMMRQMGMAQEDVKVSSVIINLQSGEKMIFENPTLQKIKMQGQETFQLSGEYTQNLEKKKIEISNDDVDMVSEQAQVSKKDAKLALEQNLGDIAEAIVSLKK